MIHRLVVMLRLLGPHGPFGFLRVSEPLFFSMTSTELAPAPRADSSCESHFCRTSDSPSGCPAPLPKRAGHAPAYVCNVP